MQKVKFVFLTYNLSFFFLNFNLRFSDFSPKLNLSKISENKEDEFTKYIHEYSNLVKKTAAFPLSIKRRWPQTSFMDNKNLSLPHFNKTDRESIEDFLRELYDVKMNLCKLLQNQWSILRDFNKRAGIFFYFKDNTKALKIHFCQVRILKFFSHTFY